MIVAGGTALPAIAADKPVVAPPGAWVIPTTVPADDGKGGDAPVKVLLQDEQYDFAPGKVTRYLERVWKVQTPQGLPAGAVTVAWNPDIQTVTLHKLQIRRGAQVIDVLALGQSLTVMRRETNLDNAVLDGQLTASIQPEGLQVGDVIDFSVSITSSDPATGNHVEAAVAAWNEVPIARAHLRAQWPSSVALQIRGNGGLVIPQLVRKGGLSSMEVATDNLQPLVLPKGAPPRFQYGRMIEITDLPAWNGIVTILAPLYARAEAQPANGAMKAEIAKIQALSADPKVRAEAALALVQDRVRYVFLGMNDGGLVPADAETTWSRRFGDCKGKTVLLVAVLHALGIDADPVLVSTVLGDGLDKRLPQIGLFDHVLVRARIAGRVYWLDGTRVGDRSLDSIQTPNFHWGLPLTPGTAALVAMTTPPYETPQTEVAIKIDATGGLTLPAPIHIDRLVRGDEALVTNITLSNLVGDARDRALRQFWKQRYDFAEPKIVAASYDPIKRELRLAMDGTTKMDWSQGWYEADHVWVGYAADFSRDPGPNSDAPFAVNYPTFAHVTETILLPPKAGTFTIDAGSDVDQMVAGIEYHRHARIDGDRFVVEESERSVAPEFPAAQAAAAQQSLRALAKKSVFLNRPTRYASTPSENHAVLQSEPSTAPEFVTKAGLLLGSDKYDAALALLDKAIALDPKLGFAFSLRAMAHLGKNDAAAAKLDLDTALRLNPRDAAGLMAKGYYAQQRHEFAEAIAAYSASLEIAPSNPITLMHRADCYYLSGKGDLAMADATAVLKQLPTAATMYLLRANILMRKGDIATTAREADALLAANPKDPYSLVTAGKILAAVGRHDDAMRVLGSALAIQPQAYIYLNRYYVRPKSDLAGRQADLEQALTLDPKLTEAIATKAAFLGERGDWKGAAALFTRLLASNPVDTELLAARGVAYAKSGAQALAEKDFAAARSGATTAPALNNLCWAKATAGVALERALQECDAALALSPGAVTIRDSRAFVLLRLGRFDDALAEYGKILAQSPNLPSSLYGRALAEARKGDASAAARDADAALKVESHIREQFEGYGMTMVGGSISVSAKSS
ncbi:MAG: DUF3857 domain-containing protein [Novosphingobium sp.]|nr:DUF3857 domain-containing protein [Novosphingobium sp.]